MITQFTCSNFKNIEVDMLEFGRINLLIGPNNAGKSNFIRALSFAANMTNNTTNDVSGFIAEVQRNGSSEIIRHGSTNRTVHLKWRIALQEQPVDYTLDFYLGKTEKEYYILNESVDSAYTIAGNEVPFNYFRFHDGKPGYGMFSTAYQFGEKNKRVHVHADDTETCLRQFDKLVIQNKQLLRSAYIRDTMFVMLEEMRQYFSKFYSYASSKFDFEKICQLQEPSANGKMLSKDGSNFLNIYRYACTLDKDFENRFYNKMKGLISDLEKIEVVEGLDKVGMKLHMCNSEYMLSEVSDGTIEALLLALLTSLPLELSPTLLAIDEPEVNLHPAWQGVLAKWLQTSANFNQCFISTHSSDFLDAFTDGFINGLVNIFVYDPLGEMSFKAINRERINEELSKGWMLGDLYRVNDPSIGGWPW